MTEQDWKRLYSAAALETDWSRIEEHIQAAESAISHRLHELSLNDKKSEENEAITKATLALQALRNDVAAWRLKQG